MRGAWVSRGQARNSIKDHSPEICVEPKEIDICTMNISQTQAVPMTYVTRSPAEEKLVRTVNIKNKNTYNGVLPFRHSV